MMPAKVGEEEKRCLLEEGTFVEVFCFVIMKFLDEKAFFVGML